MDNKKVQKKVPVFSCKSCDYTTIRKSQYKRHLATQKHKWITSYKNKIPITEKKYICECNKVYKFASGLSKHRQKCEVYQQSISIMFDSEKNEESDDEISENKTFLQENSEKFQVSLNTQSKKYYIDPSEDQDNDLLGKILQENSELRKMMVQQQEQISEMIPKIGNNNTNQQFNLNVFLNQECKDAINWSEFVESIDLGMDNLKYAMNTSMTSGVVDVLCSTITDLDVNKRPIHCLDSKRKKLCIKEEGNWEYNEEKNKEIISQSSRIIQQNYVKLIKEWESEHPNWISDSKETDEYMLLVQKIMGNVDNDKCINAVSKATPIPKKNGS